METIDETAITNHALLPNQGIAEHESFTPSTDDCRRDTLDLAIRLSKALGKTLDDVFPGAGQALTKHEREGGPYLPPSLNEYGIETDRGRLSD